MRPLEVESMAMMASIAARPLLSYVQATFLVLSGVIIEESKWIVEVEHKLWALADKRRVVSGDSARLGVVRDFAGDLAVGLEHAHEHEDLELADDRDVVPLLLRSHIS